MQNTPNPIEKAQQKIEQFSQLVIQINQIENELKTIFSTIKEDYGKRLEHKEEEIKILQQKNNELSTENLRLKRSSTELQHHNENLSHAIWMKASTLPEADDKKEQKELTPKFSNLSQSNPSPSSTTPSTSLSTTPMLQSSQTMHTRVPSSNNNNYMPPRSLTDRGKASIHKKNDLPPPPPSGPPPPLETSESSPVKLQEASNTFKDTTPNSKLPDADELFQDIGELDDEPDDEPDTGIKKFFGIGKKKDKDSGDQEVGVGGLDEKEFYKKYWIEAGKIGEGAFSRIRRITRKADKKVYALKMIKKKGKSQEDIIALQKEISVLQKCNHPNIINLLDWCDTKKRIYMVVDFCDGGDVFQRILEQKKFSEQDAANIIKQVASALTHIHEKKVIHRDLKPDNLMYISKDPNSEVKIIDFGLAGDCSEHPCTTPCGTAHYAAPEVLEQKPYNTEADMWSLGVILFTLLCGFPPFFDATNNQKNLYHLIKQGKYSFPSPYWDNISNDAKDLIKKLLLKDPKQRLTAAQVLQHPWVQGKSANKDTFSDTYIHQMNHWQSNRHFTERKLGQEGLPEEQLAQPLNLYTLS